MVPVASRFIRTCVRLLLGIFLDCLSTASRAKKSSSITLRVVLTHAPALKRALCGDVVVAIAAKDAQAAATAAKGANAKAAHLRDNATQKKHPKASICPELPGDISFKDGQKLVYCKGCKGAYSYAGWAHHCGKHHATVQNCIAHHSKVEGKANADDGDKDDDEGSRSKPQPKAKAGAKKKPQRKAKGGAKKTKCLKGPTAKKKTSPKEVFFTYE